MAAPTLHRASRQAASMARLVCLLILAASTTVAAQPATTLVDLSRHVRSGQTVYLFLRDGERAQGRFIRTTPDTLTVYIDGRSREFPSGTVLRIDKRDSVVNGAIIGGAILGFSGMGAAGASCSPDCEKAVPLGGLVFGAMGAGVGALIDRGIRGYLPVYIAAPSAPVERAGPVRPGAAAGTTLAPGWLPSLGQLWIRVAPRDKIRVVDAEGHSMQGLFIQASADSVNMLVDGRPLEISASRVRRVSRVGHYARRGFVIGLIAGGTADLVAAAKEGEGGVAALFAGGLWGGLIGWAVPRHTVVYEPGLEAPKASVHLAPVVTPGRTAIYLSVAF